MLDVCKLAEYSLLHAKTYAWVTFFVYLVFVMRIFPV